MKLRRKIAFSICTVVTFLLGIMCFSIYAKSADILYENATNLATIQILRAQENIDLMVEKIKLETFAFSKDEEITRFFEGSLSNDKLNIYLTEKMNYMNESDGYYKDLFIVDTQGVIVATTMPNAMNVDLSSREYIQKGLQTSEVQMSDILMALTDKASIVNSVYPIFNISKEIIGAFGIAIKAEEFTKFTNDYNIGQTGYFAIIDSNSTILSHKDASLIHHPATDLNISVNPNFQEKSDAIYNASDANNIFFYKQMTNNNWMLLVALPKYELQSKVVDLLKYIILYGGIIIVSALFICLFLSNKITTPIANITHYLEEAQSINDLYDNLSKDENPHVNVGFFDKEAITLIEKSQEMYKSLEMKTYLTAHFMSMLSHDIRSSLTLIKGYSRGLLSGVVIQEETKEKFIKEIYLSADILEKIAYDVLDSTYEVQNHQEIKRAFTDLEPFTQELYSLAQKLIENADRLFRGNLEIPKGTLYIDRVKIIRVWQNLVNNAVKYSQEYEEIFINIIEKENRILFSVTDQGIGVKENDKQYIFDMFYKSNLTEKKSYGLGLFISKSIIEGHGSVIEFDSTVNKGSTFWFYLDKQEKIQWED